MPPSPKPKAEMTKRRTRERGMANRESGRQVRFPLLADGNWPLELRTGRTGFPALLACHPQFVNREP